MEALIAAIKAFTYEMSEVNKIFIKKIAFAYLKTTQENIGKTGNPDEKSLNELVGWMDKLLEPVSHKDEDETVFIAHLLPRLTLQRSQADMGRTQTEIKQLTDENERLRQEVEQLRRAQVKISGEKADEVTSEPTSPNFF